MPLNWNKINTQRDWSFGYAKQLVNFEWYRNRLLGDTTNVCERLLFEREIITLFFPCLFELTAYVFGCFVFPNWIRMFVRALSYAFLARRLIISVRACFVVVLVCDRASSILILMFVGTFFRTKNIHTPFFTCLFVLDSSLARVVLYRLVRMVMAAFCRTRNIHTLHSPVYRYAGVCAWVFGGFVVCERLF